MKSWYAIKNPLKLKPKPHLGQWTLSFDSRKLEPCYLVNRHVFNSLRKIKLICERDCLHNVMEPISLQLHYIWCLYDANELWDSLSLQNVMQVADHAIMILSLVVILLEFAKKISETGVCFDRRDMHRSCCRPFRLVYAYHVFCRWQMHE